MRAALLAIIAAIVLAGGWYLATAFFYLDLDPRAWSEFARFWLGMVGYVVLIYTVAFIAWECKI